MVEVMVVACGASGAELGALLGANQCGLETGGWALPDFDKAQLLNMHETPSTHWECTQKCIEIADLVVIVGTLQAPHAQAVVAECGRTRTEYLRLRYNIWKCSANTMLRQARILLAAIYQYNAEILYVTGCSEQQRFGIEGYTQSLIVAVKQELFRPGSLPKSVHPSRTGKPWREQND
jgi:hypothetical protein